MNGVEVSGSQTVATALLTPLQQPVGVGARGDCRFTVGTLVVGAVAVLSNLPVSVNGAFVTAIRTVERCLSRRRISEGFDGGQRVYIYRLQVENPRASTLRERSIMGIEQLARDEWMTTIGSWLGPSTVVDILQGSTRLNSRSVGTETSAREVAHERRRHPSGYSTRRW